MTNSIDTITPAWLIADTFSSPTIHEAQPDGTLDMVCFIGGFGYGSKATKRARLIAQAPRMLAALKAVANLDLPAEELAMVCEIIAAAERTKP